MKMHMICDPEILAQVRELYKLDQNKISLEDKSFIKFLDNKISINLSSPTEAECKKVMELYLKYIKN
jgi:hypothetical protein